MNKFALYPEENTKRNSEIIYPTVQNSEREIKEGMTPTEIANVISDHLISFVDKAFQSKTMELKNPQNL